MRIVLTTLGTTVLCASLAAQVPPAITKTKVGDNTAVPDFTGITENNWQLPAGHPTLPNRHLPFTDLAQVELRSLGNGMWRVAATVKSVPAVVMPNTSGTLTGANYEPVEGLWDETKSYVVAAVDANTNYLTTNLLATLQQSFSLSISKDGLRAVYDNGAAAGMPHWSSRPVAITAASGGYLANTTFAAPTPIAGTVAGFGDSRFFYMNGQESLVWVDSTGAIFGSAISNTGVLTGTTRQIIRSISMGSHSPDPMSDANGDVRAWCCSGINGSGDSDSYFTPGVDDSVDAPQMIYDDIFWQANSGQFGPSGTTIWAHDTGTTATYVDPIEISMVAVNGQTFQVSQASQLNLRVFVPKSPNPWLTALFIGLPGPATPIPGTLGNALASTATGPRPPGQAGFLLTGFVTLQKMAPANSGGATYTLPVPANSVLPGTPLTVQPVAFDIMAGSQAFIGNTATVIGQ